MSIPVKHNARGYAALLKLPRVRADVHRRAGRVADAAGPGFVAVQSAPVRTRARSAVVATTAEANIRNSRDNVLIRSLDAGRG